MTVQQAPSTARAATGRNLAALAARAWRLEVHGADLVPSQGPVVMVANHTGFLDGLVLAAAAPRPVHVLADAGLFAPPLDRLLRGTGQIPLHSDRSDRAAARTALAVLAGDGVLGVFPEGERGSGEARHAGPLAAYLAVRAGAAVVPAAIFGTRGPGAGKDSLPRLRSRLVVVIGPPTRLPPVDARRRAAVSGAGERVRQLLADHVRGACSFTGLALPGPLPSPSTHHTRSDS